MGRAGSGSIGINIAFQPGTIERLIDAGAVLARNLEAFAGVWRSGRGNGMIMDFKAVAFEVKDGQFQVDGAVFLIAQDLVHSDLLEHKQGVDKHQQGCC